MASTALPPARSCAAAASLASGLAVATIQRAPVTTGFGASATARSGATVSEACCARAGGRPRPTASASTSAAVTRRRTVAAVAAQASGRVGMATSSGSVGRRKPARGMHDTEHVTP